MRVSEPWRQLKNQPKQKKLTYIIERLVITFWIFGQTFSRNSLIKCSPLGFEKHNANARIAILNEQEKDLELNNLQIRKKSSKMSGYRAEILHVHCVWNGEYQSIDGFQQDGKRSV